MVPRLFCAVERFQPVAAGEDLGVGARQVRGLAGAFIAIVSPRDPVEEAPEVQRRTSRGACAARRTKRRPSAR
jgi:hypothetical protein